MTSEKDELTLIKSFCSSRLEEISLKPTKENNPFAKTMAASYFNDDDTMTKVYNTYKWTTDILSKEDINKNTSITKALLKLNSKNEPTDKEHPCLKFNNGILAIIDEEDSQVYLGPNNSRFSNKIPFYPLFGSKQMVITKQKDKIHFLKPKWIVPAIFAGNLIALLLIEDNKMNSLTKKVYFMNKAIIKKGIEIISKIDGKFKYIDAISTENANIFESDLEINHFDFFSTWKNISKIDQNNENDTQDQTKESEDAMKTEQLKNEIERHDQFKFCNFINRTMKASEFPLSEKSRFKGQISFIKLEKLKDNYMVIWTLDGEKIKIQNYSPHHILELERKVQRIYILTKYNYSKKAA